MRRIILMCVSLLLFVATLILTFVCINNKIDGFFNHESDKVGADGSEKEYVEVYLSTDENCTVAGENPVRVRIGSTASFQLVFNENFSLDKCSADYRNGFVYVLNCQRDQTHTVSSKRINDYYTFDYALSAVEDGEIISTKAPGRYIANQLITVTAKPKADAKFTGWSVGGTVLDGGTMVSYATSYTFKLSESIKLYPNFLKEGFSFVKYHLNGGVLASDGVTDVIVSQVNTSIKACPNLMADNGQIVRDGYTLLEFTTGSDGSGIAINPGGLADIPDSGVLEVYAQWSKWTDASNFNYVEDSSFVTITSYKGDDATVSIPAYINGKPVVHINSGAFVGKSFDTLILPRTVTSMDTGAFKDCLSFDTLYICDTFKSIPDDAFTNCKKFSKLRLNAGRNPSYPVIAESVATRLSYIMTRENYSSKPIILLVGGSSALFGFDSRLFEELLDFEYYVLNCGTNAGGCGMLYIEALSSFLRPGDIVMNVPEFGNVQFGDFTLYWRTFRATECCYNIYRYVDFSKYTKFFTAMSEFNSSAEARGNLSEKAYEVKNTSLTDINCDINSTRLYQDRVFSSISINSGLVTAARVRNFNTVIDLVEAKGIKYYIGAAPVYGYGFKSSDAEVGAFVNAMNSSLHAPYISDPLDYKYAKELFYDSTYHLTTEGAKMRTRQLAEDIKKQLASE